MQKKKEEKKTEQRPNEWQEFSRSRDNVSKVKMQGSRGEVSGTRDRKPKKMFQRASISEASLSEIPRG